MADPHPETTVPVFMDRRYRHTGPAQLDYERGEFWIHRITPAGEYSCAPFMRQREGESLETFMKRVAQAEAAIPGWEFPLHRPMCCR